MIRIYLRNSLESYNVVKVESEIHHDICLLYVKEDWENTELSNIIYIHNNDIYLRFFTGELYICIKM